MLLDEAYSALDTESEKIVQDAIHTLSAGKTVVAIPNEVIAVGDDEAAVRAEAAEKLGLPANSLVTTVIAPLESRILYDWF